MADIWLDGYVRMPLGDDVTGMEYVENDDPKLLWHKTQGTSVAGAINAYRPYPPHMIVNPRTDERVQHIPLNLAAYSLAGTANDRSRVIQVEVVGYSEDAHLTSDDELRWLGENVVRPIRDAFDVPDQYLRCWAEHEIDVILASPDSPIRLSIDGLRAYAGHLGHQHAPAPDEHWDPGGLDLERIIQFSRQREDTPPRKKVRHDVMIFTAEVISDPIKAGDPALVGTTVTGGVPIGMTLMVDTTNRFNFGMGPNQPVRDGSKDIVPHWGVSGGTMLEFVKRYVPKP